MAPARRIASDIIGELASDGVFLAAANPLRTLQALSASTDELSLRAYACYSLAFDRLTDQPLDARLSYLEMTARQQADDDLAEMWGRSGIPLRWRVPWARGNGVKPPAAAPSSHDVH